MVSLTDLESIGRLESVLMWSALWTLLLMLPPGSTQILTAYRLNFLMGTITSVLAFLCLSGYIPETIATMSTISYFIVDFCNILVNDFVFRVPSYQKPTARKVEYFHHCFCCFVGLMCEFTYRDYCNYTANPFVRLMFAEVPTPFLMAWRYTENDIFGYLFAAVFFAVRVVYHGFFLIPEFIQVCHPSVGYGFGVPYNLMNAVFFYMIVTKLIRSGKAAGKKEKKKEN